MTGKELKEIVRRIPDDAVIGKLCERYVSWRNYQGRLSCYSFYPEKLDNEKCSLK